MPMAGVWLSAYELSSEKIGARRPRSTMWKNVVRLAYCQDWINSS